MRALIFDCDGVLADTERHGHLPAFNQTFEEFGLPVRWSEEDYAHKLLIGGGKERLMSLMTPQFVEAAGLPADEDSQRQLIKEWHRRKTEIYAGRVTSGELSVRPGVCRLIEEALDAGWPVAVASTSARPSVVAVLDRAAGGAAARIPVFAGDDVPSKKPAPDIYLLALERLHIPADRGVAIEDSRNGLLAAKAAGLSCLVTLSSYTKDEDMKEAELVVTTLGDPDGESAVVVANRTAAEVGAYVTLEDLEGCIAGSGREAA